MHKNPTIMTIMEVDFQNNNNSYKVVTSMKQIYKNENGYAAVEAAILFPIIFMIFFAIIMLSMYLPTRAVLQHATQYTTNVLATENSDTWIKYDENSDEYVYLKKSDLTNVYVSFFGEDLAGAFNNLTSGNSTNKTSQNKAKIIVQKKYDEAPTFKYGELDVEFTMLNYLIYKEIIVTATNTIPIPLDFSFIGFPKEIKLTVTSIATVQDGDEFLRNIDIAVDVAKTIDDKLGISEMLKGVKDFSDGVGDFLGWN